VVRGGRSRAGCGRGTDQRKNEERVRAGESDPFSFEFGVPESPLSRGPLAISKKQNPPARWGTWDALLLKFQ